jgi:hypothetical protein
METYPYICIIKLNIMTSVEYSEEIRRIRTSIIDTIAAKIKEAGANEIELDKPISFETYDENQEETFTDYVERINREDFSATINYSGRESLDGNDLESLETKVLLAILTSIEFEQFEIWEEISQD